MAGYIGTKSVNLSTTAANVGGDADIGGALDVGGAFTSQGIDDNATSTAMTLDTSGNVGIGTSSPTAVSGTTALEIIGTSGNAGAEVIIGSSDTTATGGDLFGGLAFKSIDSNGTSPHYSGIKATAADTYGGASLSFYAGRSNYESNDPRFVIEGPQSVSGEAMRVDASGNLLVGTTDSTLVGRPDTARLCVDNENGEDCIQIRGSGSDHLNIASWVPVTGNAYHIGFGSGTSSYTEHGVISTNGSTTTYSTTSDHRLKENVVDLEGATERLKQLRPKRFNFIVNPNTILDGFLAHEAQVVVPEAVTGTKDAMRDERYEVTPAVTDDDGNVTTEAVMGTRSVPAYQGIDQSKLVPLLTAALQEALDEITDLKARVATLEAN